MIVEKGKRDEDRVSCLCIGCKAFTKHTILSSIDITESDEHTGTESYRAYDILQCNGCESTHFRLESSSSDYYDPITEHPIPTVRVFPEVRTDTKGGAPYLQDEFYNLPGMVQSIYGETQSAISDDLTILAGIGIRTILEAVCQDLNTTGVNLAKKIDGLVTASLMTTKGAEILHGLRLLGNEAAHELKAPSTKQISAAMKVIDHLLIGAYVIPKEAQSLPKYEPAPKNTSQKVKAQSDPGITES